MIDRTWKNISSFFKLVTYSTERPRYEKIASGYHDKGNCEFYCSEYKWNYGKSFVCQFHGKEKIKQLLLKNPNVPLKARNDPFSPFVQKTLETENDYKLIQATQEVYLWLTFKIAFTCSILTSIVTIHVKYCYDTYNYWKILEKVLTIKAKTKYQNNDDSFVHTFDWINMYIVNIC